MGPFLQGQWEGVAPVAGTFLVFLRNFSKELRNVAACESVRPAVHDAFVLQRAGERGTPHTPRNGNQWSLLSPKSKKVNTQTGK